MLYNTNIARLVVSLLPHTLRRPVVTALTVATARPLDNVAEKLRTLIDDIDTTIAVNNSVRYLEDRLNALFHLTNRQIYISQYRTEPIYLNYYNDSYEDPASPDPYFTFETEADPEPPQIDLYAGRQYQVVNIVMIPSFLVSSTHTDDPGEQAHLALIKATINQYKPVGRVLDIKTYQYE